MTAHPTVVDRLVEQLDDLANIVDALDVETFADDDLHAAAQRLTEGLEAGLRAVEARRVPHVVYGSPPNP